MISRLALTDFRNHASALLEPAGGFVLLAGPNGAGKTNILEAVSLLAPGRGLRRTAYAEIARRDGAGGFGVAAELGPALDGAGPTTLGTGTLASAPDRRLVRVNGASAAANSLGEWLAVLWLTPAMDRLFTGPASDRRRFLDRLVLALEPGHATHSARYEAAMRARNKLLVDPGTADPQWLDALEQAMAEHGNAVGNARIRTVKALRQNIADSEDSEFPSAELVLDGDEGEDLAIRLAAGRSRDSAAGRTTEGPHRQDLSVSFSAKAMPAAQSSTGEQKALLLGLVLAHAELVATRRDAPPILLLDEVAAHLDPRRRLAIFDRLASHGQVWVTATEPGLFDGISDASRFHLHEGRIEPA